MGIEEIITNGIKFIRSELKKYRLIKKFKEDYSLVLPSQLSDNEIQFLLDESYVEYNGPCFCPIMISGEVIPHYRPTNKGWNRYTECKRLF